MLIRKGTVTDYRAEIGAPYFSHQCKHVIVLTVETPVPSSAKQGRRIWISSHISFVTFLFALNGWHFHYFKNPINRAILLTPWPVTSLSMELFLCVLIAALVLSAAGNPDMLRGVVGGGARVYLLCPHHAARVLQWLQWWLRGEEEGSRLLLIKPCKCKMQPPSRGYGGWRQAQNEIHMLTGDAAKLRGVRHALVQREWATTTGAMIHRKGRTEILRWEERQAECRVKYSQ